jgi:ubiquinone/menaquinone biosynthesis C-methylase UbiE
MTIPIKIISKEEFEKHNKKPKQEEVWDNIADSWKEYRVKGIPIVTEFLKNKKGRVVDLGCGTGRNMIKNDRIEYYGIDFSKKQLKYARNFIQKQEINAKLFESKADKLNRGTFSDDMFDYGLFIATLHCLETPEERENALKEFYRILKKNAEALISVWSSEDKRFNGLKGDIYMSWKKDNVLYMRYYYLYNKQELINLLEKVGFKIIGEYNSREHDRFSRKNLIIRIRNGVRPCFRTLS